MEGVSVDTLDVMLSGKFGQSRLADFRADNLVADDLDARAKRQAFRHSLDLLADLNECVLLRMSLGGVLAGSPGDDLAVGADDLEDRIGIFAPAGGRPLAGRRLPGESLGRVGVAQPGNRELVMQRARLLPQCSDGAGLDRGSVTGERLLELVEP